MSATRPIIILMKNSATRITNEKHNGDRIVVTLGPDDTIALRQEHGVTTFFISVEDVLTVAMTKKFKEGKFEKP